MSDSTSPPASGPSRGDDRRRAQRVETNRVVYYSRADGTGPLRQGAVVNRSAAGMRIRAADTEENGTELTIELRPEGKGPDEEAALFRGRVVAVHAGERAYVELGIRLLSHRPGGVVSGGGRGPQRRYYRPVRSAVDAPFARGIRGGSSGARKKHRRYVLLLALLALLVPLTLQQARPREHRGGPASGPSVHHRAFLQSPRAAQADTGAFGTIRDRAPRNSAPAVEYSSLDIERLDRILPIPSGSFNTGPVEFASLANHAFALPAMSSQTEIVQLLARAQRADEIGERGLALSLARDAYESASRLSSAWEDAARVTLDDLQHGRPLAKRLRDMDGLVTFSDPSFPSAGGGADIEVRINRAHFSLTVLRRGVPMRAFAVGVGENGATPVGNFRIANKLTDPGWYNRGNLVPAGDPANPIGHRWMGLGGDEGATSIGIHPTGESVSIGSGLSQGCIRMWPEDAESLFRLCTIGTPVTVE